MNVWRELGSGETEMQGERRAQPEDRAGIKRAIGESNRECVCLCRCCPPRVFPCVVEGQLQQHPDRYTIILENCPRVFFLIRRIKLISIRAREHVVYATSYLSSTLVP